MRTSGAIFAPFSPDFNALFPFHAHAGARNGRKSAAGQQPRGAFAVHYELWLRTSSSNASSMGSAAPNARSKTPASSFSSGSVSPAKSRR